MNQEAVLALFDRTMRRDAPPDTPGARVERTGDIVRQTASDGGWNGVLWSDLTAGTADAAIAEQVAHFAALGHPFEWKLYAHDRPADLARRLRTAGFAPGPGETLMVAEAAALSTHVALPDGVRLEPVTDAAGVELMTAVHERAFGTDGARLRRQILGQLAAGPGRLVLVLAMAGEVPVSAARMELPPGRAFAGLWGGGTAPAWRGRGVYRALVAYRARVAVERGFRCLSVDASPESRPILRRLGFVPLSTTTPYVHRP
jgi:GNAT superfamily N-acetyltransferase